MNNSPFETYFMKSISKTPIRIEISDKNKLNNKVDDDEVVYNES